MSSLWDPSEVSTFLYSRAFSFLLVFHLVFFHELSHVFLAFPTTLWVHIVGWFPLGQSTLNKGGYMYPVNTLYP